jgi:beta-glucanase (GH16 family)
MQLVFSDEFNVEGRTFYPGDDPYWEAADLHYWQVCRHHSNRHESRRRFLWLLQTNNMEWYDPSAVVTKNGALEITLSRTENHDLHFMGGLVSTWNKFCFTGGLVEASVVLPGASNVMGLWPAIWAMGNLGAFCAVVACLESLRFQRFTKGRAGYGASLEGMVSAHIMNCVLLNSPMCLFAVAVCLRRV